MPSYVTPKNASAFITYVSLVSQANTKLMQVNPTIASGDFKVSIDGGAFANLATLPTVTPAGGRSVKISLSGAETTGDNIKVECVDASGAEWCDLVLNIQTSARGIDDLTYPTVSGRSTDVSATGEVGLDWANIGAPTTTVNLSGTTVKTATDIATAVNTVQADTDDIQTRLPAALVSGRIDASVGVTATGAITTATFAAGAINAAAIGADAITDAKVASDVTIASVTGAVGSVTGAVGSVTGAVGSVTGNVGGNVVGSVASVTAGVTVTTNNDKTGYGLSAAAVQAIWDALTSALTTVGSIGKLLVDNINATISSRLASAGYTTPPTVIAIRTEMDSNSTKLANLDATVSSRATPAQVNTEADQALADYDGPTHTELTTELATADDATLAAIAAITVPTVADILAGVIEGSITFKGAMRLVLAVLAGKSSGGGTATLTFRDVADAKARVTATVTVDGNRTAITRDITD